MARPKLIEDTVLLDLIKKYFYEECKNNIKNLKMSQIVKYINKNGYPDYPVTTLRRTKVAVDYIELLKKTCCNDDYVTVSSYQTIDAALLVSSNRSRDSLIKAISERECYYKSIADSAAHSFERYDKLKKQFEAEKENNSLLIEKNEKLEEELSDCKEKIKALTNELKANKSVVDTYVYPEIANELLLKEGAIRKTEGILKKDALESNQISTATNIKNTTKSGSKVIKGLFSVLEE